MVSTVSIKKSVGKNGANHWIDVLEIQCLINHNKHLLGIGDFLEMDGYVGDLTIEAIMRYQHDVLRFRDPDGRVDAGGTTLRSMNRTARSGLSSPSGQCLYIATGEQAFPLAQEPEQSYKDGMRRFGASRSKGKRLHAACDLYAPPDTPIYAMADGYVMRPVTYFYAGTFEMQVHHGTFVARYGEIARAAPGVGNGTQVRKGQLIAYVGELKLSRPMSMLHLELYAGHLSGPLTTQGNKYRRRADLIDPTPVLDAAQRQVARFAMSMAR